MSAELAARCTAAAAVLADYQRAAAGADVADRALWGARLADMLGLVLAGLGAQTAGPAEQLEEIRLVLESSGWQARQPDMFALLTAAEDWQIALEEIDGIVNGDRQVAPDPADLLTAAERARDEAADEARQLGALVTEILAGFGEDGYWTGDEAPVARWRERAGRCQS